MKKIGVVSLIKEGTSNMEELVTVLEKHQFDCKYHTSNKTPCEAELISNLKETKLWVEDRWKQMDAFILIGSVEVAFHIIKDSIENKLKDPAVLVLDEDSKIIIPILGTHIGNGNEFANEVSKLINTTSIITTPKEVRGKFSIEKFAEKNGMAIGSREQARTISTAILEGQRIGLCSEYPIEGVVPSGLTLCENQKELSWYSHRLSIRNEYVVGMGLKEGVSFENVETLFLNQLELLKIDVIQVKELATLKENKAEPAFLTLSEKYNIPIISFTSKELRELNILQHSDNRDAGDANISERSAFIGSGYGELIQRKVAGRGATFAAAKKIKTIYF